MKCFLSFFLVFWVGCSSTEKSPRSDMETQDAGEDVSDVDQTEPLADRYEFCEWRTFTSTGDFGVDMVGDWLVYDYQVDAGQHRLLRILDGGTYLDWSLGPECEKEAECFQRGAEFPEDFCGSTAGTLEWSVDGTNVTMDGYEWRGSFPPQWDIRLEGIEQNLYFRALDCTQECSL